MCVATGGGWAGGGARLGVGRDAGRAGRAGGRYGCGVIQVPVREPAQQPGDISTFLGSCSHDDAATRKYTRIPGSMTGIHTYPSISGAAADRHQPSTRPSPGSRIPADTTTRRYARIPGNAAQMRAPKATPCISPQTGPPEYRRIPRFLFAIRGTYQANARMSTFPCRESIVSVCARGNSSGMSQAPC